MAIYTLTCKNTHNLCTHACLSVCMTVCRGMYVTNCMLVQYYSVNFNRGHVLIISGHHTPQSVQVFLNFLFIMSKIKFPFLKDIIFYSKSLSAKSATLMSSFMMTSSLMTSLSVEDHIVTLMSQF